MSRGGSLRKKIVNDAFFSDIDSEVKAYWLGFLFADGNLHARSENCFIINLRQAEKETIERFRDALESNNTICEGTKVSTKTGSTLYDYAINIYSRQMYDDLTRLGCTSKKCHTLNPPVGVPPELVRHFIRGYNDGDGGIYLKPRRIRMRGTESMINWVAEQMPLSPLVYHQGPTSQLFICKKSEIAKAVQYMYEGAEHFLNRKREVGLALYNEWYESSKPSV